MSAPTAQRAVARAAGLAASTGAELLVVSAYSKASGPGAAERALEEAVEKRHDVKLRTLLSEGPPADATLDMALEEGVKPRTWVEQGEPPR